MHLFCTQPSHNSCHKQFIRIESKRVCIKIVWGCTEILSYFLPSLTCIMIQSFFLVKDANFDIINHQDSEGRTALHLAVAQHNEAAVRALLAVGKCQVSVQDNMKRSPLHWAAVLGLLPSHYLRILRPWYLNQGKSGNSQVCFPC